MLLYLFCGFHFSADACDVEGKWREILHPELKLLWVNEKIFERISLHLHVVDVQNRREIKFR